MVWVRFLAREPPQASAIAKRKKKERKEGRKKERRGGGEGGKEERRKKEKKRESICLYKYLYMNVQGSFIYSNNVNNLDGYSSTAE